MDKDRLDAFLRQIRLEERAINPEIQNRMSGSMIHFAEDLRLHRRIRRGQSRSESAGAAQWRPHLQR